MALDHLSGIRVVDLAGELAALAARLLADLGAEVIRVEPPDGGSMRRLAPFAGDEPGIETSLIHLYENAGKRSLVLDRMTPAGKRGFEQLIARADILLETEKLDHDEVTKVNSDLIHVTVSAFGLDGPWRDRAANDLTLAAAGGLAWLCGDPEDPPLQPAGRMAYRITALAAFSACLIALFGREREGGGVHIDISAQNAVASTTVQSNNVSLAHWYGYGQSRPAYGSALPCGDGKWVTAPNLGPRRRQAFASWAREVGQELPDPEPFTAEEYRLIINETVRVMAANGTRDEFLARAWSLGQAVMPIDTLEDVAANEHFLATGAFVPVAHETIAEALPDGRTDVSFPQSPVAALGHPKIIRAPTLGEHDTAAGPRRQVPMRGTGPLDLGQALGGIRVVDFTWVLAGPMSTRLLATFGAEVLRVSAGRRGYPDTMPPDRDETQLGAFHNLTDVHKKSISIDPRTERGRELIIDLIATADVVVENFKAGSLDRMGFGYERLQEVKPDIIVLHMPGCGNSGPWRERLTFGPMLSASAGIHTLMGFPGSPPIGIGAAYPDFAIPHVVVGLVLSALRQREANGEGADIHLSQLAATFSLIGPEWMAYDLTRKVPPPAMNRDPNYCPHGIYQTSGEEEWLAIAVAPDQFDRFCREIGRPELTSDVRFASHATRKVDEDSLDAIVRSWASQQDRFEAAEKLQRTGIAAAAVESIFDVLAGRDPQLAEQYYQSVRQESAPDLHIPVAGHVIRPAGEIPALKPAPEIGQHNIYVLRDLLRYDEDAIAELKAAGVVQDYRYFPPRGA